MSLKLTQYPKSVGLNSNGPINVLSIHYSGQMSIDMSVGIRSAKIMRDKIFIYFEKGTSLNDTLFTYKGWMKIKSATSFGANGKRAVAIEHIDSTFINLKTTWDGDNSKWESYDSRINRFSRARRSIKYDRKGIKMKKTPKFRGK